MPTGFPAPRDYNIEEGFFVDEMAPLGTPRGLHMNRLVVAGRIFSVLSKFPNPPQSSPHPFGNPLGDATLVDVVEAVPPGLVRNENHVIFAPSTAVSSSGPVNLTLFFGVDGEIMRFGLRTFFENTNTVLILLPAGRANGKNWGVGITPTQIQQLFNEVGLGQRPFVIKTIAAFSAGYRGLTGTINSTLGRSHGPHKGLVKTKTGLDLSHVDTVIFYDAFYSTDFHVQNAIEGLTGATSGQAKFVVYEVTDGGTPRKGGSLQVPIQSILASTNFSILDLKNNASELALVVARAFEGGIEDGYIQTVDAPKVIQDLLAPGLPQRTTIASRSPLAPWRPMPSGKIALSAWASNNKSAIATFLPQAESIRRKFIADTQRFNWMGWGPPDLGQVAHNGFIQEYGWEFLAG